MECIPHKEQDMTEECLPTKISPKHKYFGSIRTLTRKFAAYYSDDCIIRMPPTEKVNSSLFVNSTLHYMLLIIKKNCKTLVYFIRKTNLHYNCNWIHVINKDSCHPFDKIISLSDISKSSSEFHKLF